MGGTEPQIAVAAYFFPVFSTGRAQIEKMGRGFSQTVIGRFFRLFLKSRKPRLGQEWQKWPKPEPQISDLREG